MGKVRGKKDKEKSVRRNYGKKQMKEKYGKKP
jgi:hypothetical protein